jgi:hypothetical protein
MSSTLSQFSFSFTPRHGVFAFENHQQLENSRALPGLLWLTAFNDELKNKLSERRTYGRRYS